ncbi:MAG: hypothetical protein CVV45_10480 [Spirochaetae bacterium HGW-Spirochaetae-10]|nr:MAG: hypothetical protein CVV45_10480 [Spirochaetae bacterium HGW-Spirochaetae-10]
MIKAMKRLNVFFSVRSASLLTVIAALIVVSHLAAQAPETKPADMNQPAQDPGGRRLAGFAETPWMSEYTQVKDRFSALSESAASVDRIEILMAVRNQYILIKRNDVLYRYNFYKTPYEVLKLTNHDLQKEQWEEAEAVLYQVKIIQPFIASDSISKKLEVAYGPRTRSTVKPETKRGADIWELEGGFIFQWYEPYNGRPYTRTIDYISDELARRILKEREEYFSAEELDLLRKMIVR